jgi:hypothetical protein
MHRLICAAIGRAPALPLSSHVTARWASTAALVRVGQVASQPLRLRGPWVSRLPAYHRMQLRSNSSTTVAAAATSADVSADVAAAVSTVRYRMSLLPCML